jgi:CheY-like chemotaxis protein
MWEPVAHPGQTATDRLIQPIDVLVVEDNPPLRHTVAAALRSDDYEVLSAADGLDALRVLEHTDPWLMLLDMQLPRMNGPELIREIRRRGIRIKVIIMTGTQDARQAAQELEADGYLAKPFEIDDLTRLADQHRPLRD